MSVGDHIKNARKSAGLTQKELADASMSRTNGSRAMNS